MELRKKERAEIMAPPSPLPAGLIFNSANSQWDCFLAFVLEVFDLLQAFLGGGFRFVRAA